jgi:hypothetical protein
LVITDWEKRQWKRILTPEEMQRENAAKVLRLNGAPDYSPTTERLLAASSSKKKPTVRIKRVGSKLQSGSIIGGQLYQQKLNEERGKAEKVLRLNGG